MHSTDANAPPLTAPMLALFMGWTPEDVDREILQHPIHQLWLRVDDSRERGEPVFEPWTLIEINFIAELARLFEAGTLQQHEIEPVWDAMEPCFLHLWRMVLGLETMPTADPIIVVSVDGSRIEMRFFAETVLNVKRAVIGQ